ncbi:MAG: hypothetical protein RLZZ232_1224 [Planctomycetota bacterium]|jgi:hypothetical protein
MLVLSRKKSRLTFRRSETRRSAGLTPFRHPNFASWIPAVGNVQVVS